MTPTTRRMLSQSGHDWDHDTIYCEAICPPEDVFYEGSEDEHYESAAVRRLRYEAAGRRFLGGDAPLIFSAALKGPFDQDSGWVNPWRSRRNHSGRISSSASRASKVPKPRNENRHSRSQLPGTQDSECHLPSPESLKQGSAEPHPFLEDDDVARVQDWRSAVQSTRTQPAFWADAASPSRDRASTRKKRATNSGRLEKTPRKKHKTDSMSPILIQTPQNRRFRAVPASSMQQSNNTTMKSSFTPSFRSTSGRPPTSTGKSSLRRQASYVEQDDDELGVEDELTEGPSSSFISGSGKLGSLIKRVSPKRAIWKTKSSDAADSEDELAQDKAANIRAAATLSSPVSNKSALERAKNSTNRSDKKQLSPCPQTAPSQNTDSRQIQKAVPPPALTDIEKDSDADMTGSNTDEGMGPSSPEFESQRDDSYFFRMRSNPQAQEAGETAPAVEKRESSPLSSISSSFDSDTWSGLSSVTKEEPLPDVEDMSQSSDTSDSSEASDRSQDPEHRQPQSSSSIVVEISGVAPTDTHSGEYVGQSNEAQEEIPEDCSETSSELSELSSMDSTLGVELASLQDGPGDQSTLEAGAHSVSTTPEAQSPPNHSSGNDDGTSSDYDFCESREHPSNVDVVMKDVDEPPTTEACTPVPQDDSQSPARQPADATMISTGDVLMTDSEIARPDVQELAFAPCAQASTLTEPEAGNQGPEPTTAEPTPTGFSLKSMLQRFVPVSPWRSSQPTDLEDQEMTHVFEGHEEHVQPTVSVEPGVESSSETHIEEPSTQPSHSVVNEASLETAASHPAASDTLMIPGPQAASGSVEEIYHQSPSPPRLEKELEPAEPSVAPAEDDEGTQEATDEPMVLAQQSPWSKSQGTQWLDRVLDSTATVEPVDVPSTPNTKETPAKFQTPWPTAATPPPVSNEEVIPSSIDKNEENHASSHDDPTSAPLVAVDAPPTTPTRPSTPPSQFTFQPFAAFMTPSPEHRARKIQFAKRGASGSRLPSTQRILASALKNPWNSTKPDRRVSWAPLPGGKEQESPSRESGDEDDAAIGMETKERAASPPPMAAVEDLPTSLEDDFQGHFNAVAKRANTGPKRILPTEPQESDSVSQPFAMAENLLAVDAMAHIPFDAAPGAIGDDEGEQESVAEDVDLTEQVFQDLEHLLRPWDLDAELDQARNETEFDFPRIGV